MQEYSKRKEKEETKCLTKKDRESMASEFSLANIRWKWREQDTSRVASKAALLLRNVTAEYNAVAKFILQLFLSSPKREL